MMILDAEIMALHCIGGERTFRGASSLEKYWARNPRGRLIRLLSSALIDGRAAKMPLFGEVYLRSLFRNRTKRYGKRYPRRSIWDVLFLLMEIERDHWRSSVYQSAGFGIPHHLSSFRMTKIVELSSFNQLHIPTTNYYATGLNTMDTNQKAVGWTVLEVFLTEK